MNGALQGSMAGAPLYFSALYFRPAPFCNLKILSQNLDPFLAAGRWFLRGDNSAGDRVPAQC